MIFFARTFVNIHPGAGLCAIVLLAAVYLWFKGGFPTSKT